MRYLNRTPSAWEEIRPERPLVRQSLLARSEPRTSYSRPSSSPIVLMCLPSPVLMTYSEFERLTGKRRNLVDALSMPGLSSIDFDLPRAEVAPRGVNLS